MRNRAKYAKTCKKAWLCTRFFQRFVRTPTLLRNLFFYFFSLKYLEKESETKIIAQNKSSSQSEDNRKQRSGMKCIIKNDRV